MRSGGASEGVRSSVFDREQIYERARRDEQGIAIALSKVPTVVRPIAASSAIAISGDAIGPSDRL